MPGEDERELVVAEGPVLVGEADAAVGLGVAGPAPSIPGIPMRIRLVVPVLQGWLGEPFGLVDDEQVHDLRGLSVVVDVAGDGQRRLD